MHEDEDLELLSLNEEDVARLQQLATLIAKLLEAVATATKVGTLPWGISEETLAALKEMALIRAHARADVREQRARVVLPKPPPPSEGIGMTESVGRQHRPVENLWYTDNDGNPTGGMSSGQGFLIVWQDGVQERNGAFLEEVLGACRARFEFFQAGKFASDFYASAIAGIDAALAAMGERFADRAGRGVEGTYQA